ncbi:MAG: glycosyltransferase family 1 protein [Phycisphaerales bacterium]|nr:glycosyltransferase family 1 protein [Phycisphaerales bacterium]
MTESNGKPHQPQRATRSRIAWLVPKPIEGSGGHRTILQNIEALERAGHECHVFVEDPPARPGETLPEPAARLGGYRERFERFFGFTSDRIHLGFQIDEPFDLVFATAWFTAQFAARARQARIKAYFVQDYEAYFMPVNDGYLRAVDSYQLGLSAVTIGRWLTRRLTTEAGCPATYFEFCADGRIYRPNPGAPRERAVCAIYQPEKPRRCPVLLTQSLALLKQHKPDVKIYLYGTREKPNLPFEHEHLGLIDVEACAALYNRCSVGLCISATNPSRIPFEMMACGLPVVDVYRENNLFDMPESGVMLAAPRPDSLARAAALLLDDQPRWDAMSAFAREFMRPRTLEHGFEQFVAAAEDLLAGRTQHWTSRAGDIVPLYRRPQQLPLRNDPLTGRPLRDPPQPTKNALVARGIRERLEAMEELDRIFGARSWQTIEKLKRNPLYRAAAAARFGPGWDKADPKEDPRTVLARVRNSRSFRLIASTKAGPVGRLLRKGDADASDPFRPTTDTTGEHDAHAPQR